MKTIKLAPTQIDIDTTTEDSTRRSLIDAAVDRATEAFNDLPNSLITGCAFALLTSFFALEFALRLSEGDDDPQDVTALRHETLREVLRLAGLEFDCKMTTLAK